MWNAQSVAFASAIVATLSCVLAVWSAFRASAEAKKLRSTTSTLAELAEIRDYMGKVDAWAKRINARETMRERRAAEREESSTLVSGAANSKDELRRRAGLVAGRPARHREAS
ncbi:MAG TPA: hypothetical protein VGK73_28190 [Polyangiaceae bacterium]